MIKGLFDTSIINFIKSNIFASSRMIKTDKYAFPNIDETPSEYAERLGVLYTSLVSDEHKKEKGQFFTPLPIANYMAFLCGLDKSQLKILDPGCGIGILSTALIEKLVNNSKKIEKIELVVFETDINILPYAENCFEYLRSWLSKKGIDFTFFLCKNDFILHNSIILNNDENILESYDIIISNPPYFKLSNNDDRAIAAKKVIYGQTNIYTIFLLIAAKLLSIEGQLIFITPRSFCSGSYFRLFRELFFSMVDLKQIHLFNSRNSAFKKDKVLQENVIISANRKSRGVSNQIELPLLEKEDEVSISTSNGINDIYQSEINKYKYSRLINLNSYQKILHLPSSKRDVEVIDIFKTWTGSLKLYGLEVSTGPVVDFRSIEMIKLKKTKNTVPLLWLHNVESMNILWPRKVNKSKPKGQFILNNKDTKSRLVKNRNYVLLRRFSTKEDKKRLIAAPYFTTFSRGAGFIGIENHLNYIYHKNKELTIEETLGLSTILNSSLFDLYFRTFNGNINVSATELRDFPLPNFELIKLLGEKIRKKNQRKSHYNLDKLISEVFNLSIDFTKEYGK